MGFSQAISGMNAASSQLDVIGNNIANSQTVGFKSGSVTFADMFAGSKVGLGVTVASVNQDFKDGTTTTTNRGLDVAISGQGFFRMQDPNGSVYYTRNGQFSKDAKGFLTNAQGMYLTGYPAAGTPPTIQQGADPVPIQIPTGLMPAKASTQGTMVLNLNSANKAVDPAVAFDPSKVDSYTYATSMTTYDSLGNVHNMNLYFVKGASTTTAPITTTWKVYSIDSADPAGKPQDAGNLTFDSNGELAKGTAPLTLNMAASNGAPAQTFKLDFTSTRQQNTGKDGVTSKTQDGYKAGELTGYQINDDGTITGSYTNQQKQLLGQIVMANFAAPEGLVSEGNNVWSESAKSGQPIVGTSGTSGLGSLTSGAVEASNVDLSKQLVDMIVAQRNYQSNAQTIKTQDQILQTLVNLR
ncbi:flagellar hook protein FlgE [Edwardsiella anguillarum]|uniref:flagellar hook protein FlgE n=1 Tax=Edwardsiella TaxID=635 RepID=UPI00045D1A9C|nr:flagellar hook protein FlgE [Edwardsiella anguillarum]AKM48285.1 flagellar hook protein FlgE [Edwardsiella sp. EA181011]GAJ66508.1 flagellar hook protein FlgE [Edwardsiella piscicida]RFT01892.1 flagellar hook protein FlgE [Edwardsiella anguillarum]BET80443.1 flagellar hook protein FlgE [Edwardsiella anguillarum]BET83731.1 flagellar hook protein FlgE [Edwardsiella anguillarum]